MGDGFYLTSRNNQESCDAKENERKSKGETSLQPIKSL